MADLNTNYIYTFLIFIFIIIIIFNIFFLYLCYIIKYKYNLQPESRQAPQSHAYSTLPCPSVRIYVKLNHRVIFLKKSFNL